jgi:hypothetical protein
MANVGVERVHYFCPRRKIVCVLILYFTSNSGNKEYTLIDCENETGCNGLSPTDGSIFKWEYCPAYREYNIV